jgi:predicted MPP superfamily phosphohydrolase
VLIVVLRCALAGFAMWLAVFNRWCMTDPDDRRKLRRGTWLLLGLVGLPSLLGALFPEALDGPSWVVFAVFVLLEGWRLFQQSVGFTTLRSNLVPVAGIPKEEFFATRSLQVRSWQFPDAPPEMDGLTVAFVSDLHCNGAPSCEWFDRIWDIVRAVGPDLLLLGGDYLDSPEDVPLLEKSLKGLGRLAPPLGTWAVLGNHDENAAPQVRRLLRQSGAALLEERWVTLHRPDGRSLLLHGTNAPFHGVADPLRGVPPGGAHISLVHTPDCAPALAGRGSHYIFAGHTHGGQLALPLVGALVVPSRHSRRFSYGGFRIGDSHLVVSSGVGSVGLPFRVLARPEVVVARFQA